MVRETCVFAVSLGRNLPGNAHVPYMVANSKGGSRNLSRRTPSYTTTSARAFIWPAPFAVIWSLKLDNGLSRFVRPNDLKSQYRRRPDSSHRVRLFPNAGIIGGLQGRKSFPTPATSRADPPSNKSRLRNSTKMYVSAYFLTRAPPIVPFWEPSGRW